MPLFHHQVLPANVSLTFSMGSTRRVEVSHTLSRLINIRPSEGDRVKVNEYFLLASADTYRRYSK